MFGLKAFPGQTWPGQPTTSRALMASKLIWIHSQKLSNVQIELRNLLMRSQIRNGRLMGYMIRNGTAIFVKIRGKLSIFGLILSFDLLN